MVFYATDFVFNGVSNKTHNVILVDTGNDVLNEVGINYSRKVERDEGSVMNPTYTTKENEPDEVTLELALVDDSECIASTWTDEKLKSVKRWLVTDDFVQFISYDKPNYIYYFKCTKIVNKMTPSNLGILEVTFKPLTHYAYQYYSHDFSNSNITINNPSHLPYKPLIKLKAKSTNTNKTVTIGNMHIKNVPDNKYLIIDNEMMLCNDEDGNDCFDCILSGVNRRSVDFINWIELKPGENTLVVDGDCDITIKCEFPILL